jgi:Ca-activated chloride channel homolog
MHHPRYAAFARATHSLRAVRRTSGRLLIAFAISVGCAFVCLARGSDGLSFCRQPTSAAQSGGPIRSQVDLQAVDVQVKDKKGTDAKGLTASDFTVREDGNPQKIAFFDTGNGPVSVAVLVDSSSSMVRKGHLGSAQEIAARFMRIARSGDQIWAMDFTEWTGPFEEVTARQLSNPGPVNVPAAGGQGSAVYDAIATAICHLRDSKDPRQAIIVITDGVDEHSRISLDQLIDLVRSQRAQLFLIGFPSRPEFRFFDHTAPKVTLVTGHDIDNPDVVFARLAKEAGAETFIPKSENGLQDALKAVSNLLEAEYTLAYYPQKTSRKLRRIEVKVDRRGARVLTSRFLVANSDSADTVHFVKGACVVSPKFHPYSYESHLTNGPGGTVYRDGFSDPNSGWPQHPDSHYAPGGYELSTVERTSADITQPQMTPGSGMSSSSTTILGTYRDNIVASWGPSWRNFRVSASMKAVFRRPPPVNGRVQFSHSVHPAAGLVFRMNEKGYYALLVSPASEFKKNELVSRPGDYKKKLAFEVVAMTLQVDSTTGRPSFAPSVIVPWIVVDGASATDAQLAVDNVGDHITIFVNGRQVGSVHDRRFTEGCVGFTVLAPTTATFGDLFVEQTSLSPPDTSVAFVQEKPSPSDSGQAAATAPPVTVESNLVLVPVFVYDPARMAQAPKEELPCARADVTELSTISLTEPYLPTDCDATEVRGLTVKDFRLFQDGAEQKIVRMDSGAWWTLVRDNFGWHMQSSDTPGGIWDLSELSAIKRVPVLNREFQWLAYVPNNPKEGCHRISVQVDRPNLFVFARNEYCTGQTPSDPLNGTGLGKKLEHDLDSQKHGKIPLSLQTAAFYTSGNESRVDVSVQFPWKDLYRKWDTSSWTLYARIAVMGIVRRTDGSIAARFSDLLYPSYWPTFDQGGTKFIAWEKGTTKLSGGIPHLISGSGRGLGSSDSYYGNDTLAVTFPNAAVEIKLDDSSIETALDSSDPFWIPTRYKTQLDLPPGEYKLEVVLSDGWNLGRAEMPLTLAPYDRKELALSSVALCKRLRDADVAAKEAAAANFAPQYVPLVSNNAEFSLAADTSFEKDSQFLAYFEVYEPLLARNPATSVKVQMRILDADSGTVKAELAPVDAAPYEDSDTGVFRIAQTIPIRQLTKGAYRLEVRAQDSAGGITTWRAADFKVD